MWRFLSDATNLVAGINVSNNPNIYVRDLQAGTTALVSASVDGPMASGNGTSWSPEISADGRYILFHSTATNLATGFAGQSQGIENLFLRDAQTSSIYALTMGSMTPAVASASMTPDGHYVTFIGAINGTGQENLYVWNSQTAALIYTNTTAGLINVAISPDGSWIAYASGSSLWVANPDGGAPELIAGGSFDSHAALQFTPDDQSLVFVESNNICLHDFSTGTNILVSRSFRSSGPANGVSRSPAISPDGRWIAYRSTATDIIPNDTSGQANIYLYDRVNQATTLVSLNLAGDTDANNMSREPEFSGDGSTLAFQSYASDLESQAFNEYGAVFALNLASYSPTNSTGTNASLVAKISGLASAGQSPQAANPTIRWQATPGASYQVQFAGDLNHPDWQPVDGNVVFVGNNAQIIDLAPDAGRRFYRIVLSNP